MITRNEASFLIGAVHSGVSNAISQVAQKYGTVFFNTNSSSPTEAGKDCHRTKFVWDGNGTNFSTSVVKGAMTGFGRDWVLITSDYTWGRNTARGIRGIVEGNGGRIVEELVVPQNTQDFSAVLNKVRAIKPGVIATAVGGDDLTLLRRQVRENSMDRGFGWINNQQD
jgi:branched-chain amino acid transport system substrate-binding protein